MDIPGLELSDEFHCKLKSRTFARDKNPLCAIEAYLLARESLTPIPENVAAWLEECFKRWHDSQGDLSLDEVMGLSKKGRKTRLFFQAALEERDEIAMLEMARLYALGFSIEEAAAVAEYKFQTEHWNRSKHKIKNIGVEYLTDKFEEWKACHSGKEMLKIIRKKISPDYLKKVPKRFIPLKLRSGIK